MSNDNHTDQELQQALMQPLALRGTADYPVKEGLYCFIHEGRRYPIHVRATLVGMIVGSGTINPWVNRNLRDVPGGHWFGQFYSMDDCQTFIARFKIQ